MTAFFDARDTQDPARREEALLERLPSAIAAAMQAATYRERFSGIDPGAVTSREALARLPVLRKAELPALHRDAPPFGGLTPGAIGGFGRLYGSPGPIFEAEGTMADPWRCARAMHAMGFKPGEPVLNTFSYHLVPAGFMMDAGARALDCPVIPAGPGQTEQQLDVIEAFRPAAYCGTPDFLKIILDAAAKAGRDVSSLRRALVSGAAFPRSLQQEIAARGIDAFQAYASADVGVIAYEAPAREGLILNEDILLEIVRPGTGDPVAEGEVGEVVVTTFDPARPLIRFALGDLSAVLPGQSPCGRSNVRIRGWLGRADQAAKVKGMFVRPEQVAEIGRRHPEIKRLRLSITRQAETDAMVLGCETDTPSEALAEQLRTTLQAVTKLKGEIVFFALGRLPNDGKVIADERSLD